MNRSDLHNRTKKFHLEVINLLKRYPKMLLHELAGQLLGSAGVRAEPQRMLNPLMIL